MYKDQGGVVSVSQGAKPRTGGQCNPYGASRIPHQSRVEFVLRRVRGVEIRLSLFGRSARLRLRGWKMGPRISRSIFELEGRRLWTEANQAEGATLRFAIAVIP
jgi:hypothetical protein